VLLQGDRLRREFIQRHSPGRDLAAGSTTGSPQVKELNLFSLFFPMPDYAAMDALTGEAGTDKIIDKAGVMSRWRGRNGYREINSNLLATSRKT
jgi:hypothetical protein